MYSSWQFWHFSFSLPSCNQVGRFLVDLGNLLKVGTLALHLDFRLHIQNFLPFRTVTVPNALTNRKQLQLHTTPTTTTTTTTTWYTTTTTMRTTTTTTATTHEPATTTTTGTPCCMRLDIVVRNSQDNQPIPGAAINVYYQHVNGLKTVARNVTVGANGTASVEVRAGNDGSRSFHNH